MYKFKGDWTDWAVVGTKTNRRCNFHNSLVYGAAPTANNILSEIHVYVHFDEFAIIQFQWQSTTLHNWKVLQYQLYNKDVIHGQYSY